MKEISLNEVLGTIQFSLQQINPKKTGVLLLVDELIKSGGLIGQRYPENTLRVN